VKFLAEVYSPWPQNLHNLGFDFTYEKTLFDKLVGGNLDDIKGYIKAMPLEYHQKSAHFVENHDEPRAPVSFGGNQRADAAAMVSMTLPGMRFYFSGQENGFWNKLDVHLRRAKSENPAVGVPQFYDKLFSILNMEVFHLGVWTYLEAQNSDQSWRLLTWKWVRNTDKILCVINYSTAMGTGNVQLVDALPFQGNDSVPVTDLLTGTTYWRSAQELKTKGLYVVVEAFSGQFFKY